MPHFDIVVTDLEAKQDRVVASVRHNGQVFRLVKFPPVKTSLIKIQPVNLHLPAAHPHGSGAVRPASGKEGAPGFLDPDGQNTYMGDFSRVDPRPRRWRTASSRRWSSPSRAARARTRIGTPP